MKIELISVGLIDDLMTMMGFTLSEVIYELVLARGGGLPDILEAVEQVHPKLYATLTVSEINELKIKCL